MTPTKSTITEKLQQLTIEAFSYSESGDLVFKKQAKILSMALLQCLDVEIAFEKAVDAYRAGEFDGLMDSQGKRVYVDEFDFIKRYMSYYYDKKDE